MATPSVWDEDFQCYVHASHIADPSGGVTQDAESRAALTSVLSALRAARIIGRDSTSTVESQTAGAGVWDANRQCYVLAAAISNPTGGATADTELRTAVGQILTALRGSRIVAHTDASGPTVWDEDANCYVFSGYTTPTGGATTDAEGRTTANAIAVALRSANLLSQD